jgi:hypothetical protein
LLQEHKFGKQVFEKRYGVQCYLKSEDEMDLWSFLWLLFMDYYPSTGSMFAYGKVLTCNYGGSLYARDAKTGDTLWIFNATSIGRESPYSENYPLNIAGVCDGKLYVFSTEHSPTKPLWRGAYLRCINITDGTEMWKLLDFNMGLAIADGYIISGNQYDNLIYCIGKGPSAVTVEAPLTAIPLGSSVVIRGTVTDQSPGAKKLAQKLGADVAAVADDDMQAWMEYLYEQQALPTNAKGVEVTIDAIDPNNNFVHLGTATTDTSGAFSLMVEPEGPGKYTVIATFAGSKSYAASYAETAFGVEEVPPAPQPEPQQIPDNTMTIVGTGIGLAIVVAVVGAILALLIRKRP